MDEVLSFAPQTFINPIKRFIYFERRWKREIKKIHRLTVNKKYLDVKHLLQSKEVKTRFQIYFCCRDRLDNYHAMRMIKYANVKLNGYDEGGHELIKKLKNSGQLKHILLNALLPLDTIMARKQTEILN